MRFQKGVYQGFGIKKGQKLSEETKRKMSLSRMGDNNVSKRLDVREKISEGLKGKRHTKEQIENWKVIIKKKWDKIGRVSQTKEYIRKKSLERIARKKGAEGSHTLGDWELLKNQYDWTCPACKRKEPEINLTEDHIIPLSKGGSDWIENIQPLCLSCNSKKHTTVIRYEKD